MIFKQGQEGQGRPADVFIRRMVMPDGINLKTDNPFAFENFECTTYLDETFELLGCPTDGVEGYMCNVWGEAYGDRLCGGINDTGEYPRRDHINLTSHNVDLAVGTGPEDDTPDDPTDDIYNRHKVLLWHQTAANLGDESYGFVNTDSTSSEYGTACDVLGGEICPGMYSNARSHRGFIRGDFFVTAYSLSPNWAAGRNGNDRYNFYIRKSFDGGQTWTTNPAGKGINYCREWRTNPDTPDETPDGSGNLPPVLAYCSGTTTQSCTNDASCPTGETCVVDENFDPECVEWCPPPCEGDPNDPDDPCYCDDDPETDKNECICEEWLGEFIGAGEFEPARNISQIKSNKESSGDPRLGTTPPAYPLDGTLGTMESLCPKMGPAGTWECIFPEDEYVDNMFFVAWGTVDNAKSTGSSGVKAEAGPLDIYYTRTEDYGDYFVKIPWEIGGENSKQGVGEIEYRYDFVAKGEPEEQGECQLVATSDGSKAYVIWHSVISAEADPDEIYTRWYPWKPSESFENDLWFRRLIFWPVVEEVPTP
jgi:hypothetical protein